MSALAFMAGLLCGIAGARIGSWRRARRDEEMHRLAPVGSWQTIEGYGGVEIRELRSFWGSAVVFRTNPAGDPFQQSIVQMDFGAFKRLHRGPAPKYIRSR